MPSANILGPIEGIYRKMEDAFYTMLDWLDEHNVPAYRVHDWLEDHGIPPFPAFLTLILIIIAGLVGVALISTGPQTYTATIFVTDEDGNPVSNAKVTLHLSSGFTVTQVTDETGYAYFLDLPEPPAAVSVSADGYQAIRDKALNGDFASITLHYEEGEKMTICVAPTDSATGKVITANITGTYLAGASNTSKTFDYDSTYGVYCAEFPKGASVKVSVEAGDYRTETVILSKEYPKDSPYVLTMYKKSTVAGLDAPDYIAHVSVKFNGVPEANVVVNVRRPLGDTLLFTGMTDENGQIDVHVPGPGTYAFTLIARGQHKGWTARKNISINKDGENISVDLKEDGEFTDGVVADSYGQTINVGSQAPEENVPDTAPVEKEFNVTICAVDDVQGAPVAGATINLDGKTMKAGIDGCATFTGVQPKDQPYSVHVEGGDKYVPYDGTLAIGGSGRFVVTVRLKDSPPEVEPTYIEKAGLRLVRIPRKETVKLHFSVTIPYHLKSATLVLDSAGIPGYTIKNRKVDLTTFKGRTKDVPVEIDVGDVNTVYVHWNLEIIDENGHKTYVDGAKEFETAPVLLACNAKNFALKVDVPKTVYANSDSQIHVYVGKCGDGVKINNIDARANGRAISLAAMKDEEDYAVYAGTFHVDPKTEQVRVDIRFYDDEGKILRRFVKLINVERITLKVRVVNEENAPIKDANVIVDGVRQSTDENGFAVFSALPPKDEPRNVEVKADGYLPYTGEVGANEDEYTVTVVRKDAAPSVKFKYWEIDGKKVVAPAAGKTVTAHFEVVVPYHAVNARIRFESGGSSDFVIRSVMGKDGNSAEITAKGTVVDVPVEIKVQAAGEAEGYLHWVYTVDVKNPESGKTETKTVEGTMKPHVAGAVLACEPGQDVKVVLVAPDAVVKNGKSTAEVYVGACGENVRIRTVELKVDGSKVNLKSSKKDGYEVFKGEFSVGPTAGSAINLTATVTYDKGNTKGLQHSVSKTVKVEEIVLKLCVVNEENKAVSGAEVKVDGKKGETGSDGCAVFSALPPKDEPRKVEVKADGYLPYAGEVGANEDEYTVTVVRKDAAPSVKFKYWEIDGKKVVAPAAGKTVTAHFEVVVPYHAVNARIMFDSGGSVKIVGQNQQNLDGNRGSVIDVPVTIDADVSEGGEIYLRASLEINGKEGASEEVLTKAVGATLFCRPSEKFAVSAKLVPDAPLVNGEANVVVYVGRCANGRASVEAWYFEKGRKKIRVRGHQITDGVDKFIGTFTVPNVQFLRVKYRVRYLSNGTYIKTGEITKKTAEISVRFCLKGEDTSSPVKDANVILDGKKKVTGSDGCAVFSALPPKDEPWKYRVEAGSRYQTMEGHITKEDIKDGKYELTVKVLDTEPTITFKYMEIDGKRTATLPANKDVKLHFEVSVPYHIRSATITLDTGGIPGIVLEKKEIDIQTGGETKDIVVPIHVENYAGKKAYIRWTYKVVYENGDSKTIYGNAEPRIFDRPFICDGGEPVKFAVDSEPLPLIAGTEGKVLIYFSVCGGGLDDYRVGELNIAGRKTAPGVVYDPRDNKDPFNSARVYSVRLDKAPNVPSGDLQYVITITGKEGYEKKAMGAIPVVVPVERHWVKFSEGMAAGNSKIYAITGDVNVCVETFDTNAIDRAKVLVTNNNEKVLAESVTLAKDVQVCENNTFTAKEGSLIVNIVYYKGSRDVNEITIRYDVVKHVNDLNVHVVDDDSNPVEGATVTINANGRMMSRTTDENGYVQFSNLPDGQYEITVKRDGYFQEKSSVELGINNEDAKVEMKIYKIPESPRVLPHHVVGLNGRELVSPVCDGGKYNIVVKVLPPVATTETNVTLEEASLGAEVQFTKEGNTPFLVQLPVQHYRPGSENGYICYNSYYQYNATSKYNLEGKTGTKKSLGQQEYTFVMPWAELECDQSHGVAVKIIPMPSGEPREAFTPVKNGKQQEESFYICMGICGENYSGKVNVLAIDPESKTEIWKKSLGKINLVPLQETCVQGSVNIRSGMSKVLFRLIFNPDNGPMEVITKEIPVGRKVTIHVTTDPDVPREGENLNIFAKPDPDDVVDEPDKISIKISGGEGFGGKLPIYLKYDADTKDWRTHIEKSKLNQGWITLSCESKKYVCELLPQIIYIYSSKGDKLEIQGPDAVYAPEAPSANKVTYAVANKVQNSGNTEIKVWTSCTDGVTAEPDREKIHASGGESAKLGISFSYYPEKDAGQGKPECSIVARGIFEFRGKRYVYFAKKKVTITTGSTQMVFDKPVPSNLDILKDVDTKITVPFIVKAGNTKLTVTSCRAKVNAHGITISGVTCNSGTERGSVEFHVTCSKAGTYEVDVTPEAKVGDYSVKETKKLEVKCVDPSTLSVFAEFEPQRVIVTPGNAEEVSVIVHNNGAVSIPADVRVHCDAGATASDGKTVFVAAKGTGNADFKISVDSCGSGPTTCNADVKVGNMKVPATQLTVYPGDAACIAPVLAYATDKYIHVVVRNECNNSVTVNSVDVSGSGASYGKLTVQKTVEGDHQATLKIPLNPNVRLPEKVNIQVATKNCTASREVSVSSTGGTLVSTDNKNVGYVPIHDWPVLYDESKYTCQFAYCGKAEFKQFLDNVVKDMLDDGKKEEKITVKLKGIGDVSDVVTAVAEKYGMMPSTSNTEVKFGKYEMDVDVETADRTELKVTFTQKQDNEQLPSPYNIVVSKNYGKIREDGGILEDTDIVLEANNLEILGNVSLSSNKIDDILRQINANVGKILANSEDEGPFKVMAAPPGNLAGAARINVGVTTCDIANAVAVFYGNNAKNTLYVKACKKGVGLIDQKTYEETISNVLASIISLNSGSKKMNTTAVNDKIYVTGFGSGTGTKVVQLLQAYAAPGASTFVHLPDKGFIHYNKAAEYSYELTTDGDCDVWINNTALSKKGQIKLDLSAGYPDVQIKLKKKDACTVTLTLKTVNNGKVIDSITYVIPILPLKTTFDRLVSALTCPGFDLGGLSTDVAKSVMVAAADPSKNPCDVVGNKNVEFSAGEYNWKVETGSTLVYLAKKDGDPTPTNYDFKIEFGDGKPRVWVEDAERYSGMDKTEVCRGIQEVIPDVKEYSNYLLTVRVKGEECGGVNRYGSVTAAVVSRDLVNTRSLLTYTGTCTGAAATIYAIPASPCKASLGSTITNCVVAPVISSLMYKFNLLETLEDSDRMWMFSPIFASAGLKGGIKAAYTMKAMYLWNKYGRQVLDNKEDVETVGKLLSDDEFRESLIKAIKMLKKTGLIQEQDIDDAISTINGVATDESKVGDAVEKIQKIGSSLKNLKSTLNAKKLGMTAMCEIAPTIVGTLSWYAVAGNEILHITNVIYVNINPETTVTVKTETHSLSGGAQITVNKP